MVIFETKRGRSPHSTLYLKQTRRSLGKKRGRTQDAGTRGQIFSSRRYRALRKNTLVVLYQRLKNNGYSGLRHGFTLSTTTYAV